MFKTITRLGISKYLVRQNSHSVSCCNVLALNMYPRELCILHYGKLKQRAASIFRPAVYVTPKIGAFGRRLH